MDLKTHHLGERRFLESPCFVDAPREERSLGWIPAAVVVVVLAATALAFAAA